VITPLPADQSYAFNGAKVDEGVWAAVDRTPHGVLRVEAWFNRDGNDRDRGKCAAYERSESHMNLRSVWIPRSGWGFDRNGQASLASNTRADHACL